MNVSDRSRPDRRRFLRIAFGLALAITVLLGARVVARLFYFSRHAREPLAGWMPLGYVARSYGVPLDALRAQLGLATGARDRRPIQQIAAERGIPTSQFIGEVEQALARLDAYPAGGAFR